jgi:hypothetical protein
MSAKRKAVRCSNTRTAIKKTHVENTTIAIKSIAAYASNTEATSSFNVNPYAGSGKPKRRPAQGRATLQATPELLGPMLENILGNAVNRPDSTVFSRPESFGFGRDGLVRKAGRMALSMFSTSRPPVALEKAASGFQSHNGAETMTKVNTPTTSTTDKIARQQAIENALSAALYFIRLPGTPSALHAATGRANRALSLLKQSCADAKIGGAA